MNSSYITSAQKAEQLPDLGLPEIAVVGRSNAGKSTLLNALLQRNSLVRTGRTPGQTQMINFFGLNEQIIFADLPGYGFAKTGRDTRIHWQELVAAYIARPQVQVILFLTDIRRTLNEEDLSLFDWMGRNAKEMILIANKSDKLSQLQVNKACKSLEAQLQNFMHREVLAASALKKKGIDALRERLLNYAHKSDI